MPQNSGPRLAAKRTWVDPQANPAVTARYAPTYDPHDGDFFAELGPPMRGAAVHYSDRGTGSHSRSPEPVHSRDLRRLEREALIPEAHQAANGRDQHRPPWPREAPAHDPRHNSQGEAQDSRHNSPGLGAGERPDGPPPALQRTGSGVLNRRMQLAQDSAALQAHLGGFKRGSLASTHRRGTAHSLAIADVESGVSEELTRNVSTRWLDLAESGLELDIYTCLGLSNACSLSQDTRSLIKDVAFVTALQVIVPALMLVLEVGDGLQFTPSREALSFRLIGFLLYLYSMRNMHMAACDECRSMWLDFALEHNMPVGYWLPPLLGEISNSFVSVGLLFTLFTIFCHLEKAEDLILNAVAVNFLGGIDVEFTNAEMRNDGISNFKRLHADYSRQDTSQNSRVGRAFGQAVNFALLIVREGGTRWAGGFFALLFLFSGQPTLCAHTPLIGSTYICAQQPTTPAPAPPPSVAAFNSLLSGS